MTAKSVPMDAVIGAVVGTSLLIILLVILSIFLLCKRCRRASDRSSFRAFTRSVDSRITNLGGRNLIATFPPSVPSAAMAALPTGQLHDPEMNAVHQLREERRVVGKPQAPPMMASQVVHEDNRSHRTSDQREGTGMADSELPPPYSTI